MCEKRVGRKDKRQFGDQWRSIAGSEVGINSSQLSKSWISFNSFLFLSFCLLYLFLLYSFLCTGFSIYSLPNVSVHFSTVLTPIPTIDVFLVRADTLQTLPPLCLFLLSVSVFVSGEDVSAASFRSQKQSDHHPRDHSSHLWNDRNGVTRYLHK